MKIANACLEGIINKECDSHSGQGNPQNALGLKNKYPQADFFKSNLIPEVLLCWVNF